MTWGAIAASPEARPAGAAGSAYLPELDGLRAVAVLAVVGYHADLPYISGGFTGVDIFFVLSGFFITRQLATDIEHGRFSILGFYERRARRILPALFAVLAATFAAATIVMVPDDLMAFQRSLLSSIAFVANVYFWQDISYFAQSAGSKPLLHLWSLALEEQFYLALPLVLALTERRGRTATIAALAAAALLSLAASVWLSPGHPSASFFLLPTRAWELLLGSLIAVFGRPIARPAVRALLAWTGLALIALALLTIGPFDVFPGWRAIIPTSGAALVILASQGAPAGERVNALLRARVMVGIGLISYSLYLWHWPILAIARYMTADRISPLLVLGCVVASFVLALASWRFVEVPFRRRSGVWTPRRLVQLFGPLAAVSAGAAALVLAAGGLPGRMSAAALRFVTLDPRPRFAECFDLAPAAAVRDARCRIGTPSAPIDVIVWGDSHAYRLATKVDRLGRERGFGALVLTHASCPPLIGVNYGREFGPCRAFDDAAFTAIMDLRPSLLVMAGRWSSYADGAEIDLPLMFNALSDKGGASTTSADNRIVFGRALLGTLDAVRAAGIRVLIAGPVPNLDINAPRALAVAEQWGIAPPGGPSIGAVARRERSSLSALAAADARPGVAVFYPHVALCPGGRCRIAAGGRSLYMDGNHLSDAGNRWIHPAFVRAFGQAWQPRPRDRRDALRSPSADRSD